MSLLGEITVCKEKAHVRVHNFKGKRFFVPTQICKFTLEDIGKIAKT